MSSRFPSARGSFGEVGCSARSSRRSVATLGLGGSRSRTLRLVPARLILESHHLRAHTASKTSAENVPDPIPSPRDSIPAPQMDNGQTGSPSYSCKPTECAAVAQQTLASLTRSVAPPTDARSRSSTLLSSRQSLRGSSSQRSTSRSIAPSSVSLGSSLPINSDSFARMKARSSDAPM